MYLSVCIPTYNFEKYIKNCVESITNQNVNNKDFEIVIGDSSTNNKTFEVIKKLKKKNDNIVYKKFKQKSGIDIDLEKTSRICKGKYILFLSSDDSLIKGALDKIINFTKSNNEVYLFNRIICDKKLNIKKKPYWIAKRFHKKTFHFSNKFSLKEYISNSNSIGALFSYMSCIVIKNHNYRQSKIFKKFIGTNYLHVQKIISLLFKPNNKIQYFKDHLVLFRGDNDSFKKDGYINRILIDFYGYKLFHQKYFNKEYISYLFLKLMRREHKYYYLIRVGKYIKNKKEWIKINNYLNFYNYNKFQIFVIQYFGKSNFLIFILRTLKKKLNL